MVVSIDIKKFKLELLMKPIPADVIGGRNWAFNLVRDFKDLICHFITIN